MSNDHIGIPRFMQKSFAKSGLVASYDIESDELRLSPISKLGIRENYLILY